MPTVKRSCEEDVRLGQEFLPWSWSLSMNEFVKTGHDWRVETQELIGSNERAHEVLVCLELTMSGSCLDLPGRDGKIIF
jgi:hypothetical protein